MTSSESLKEKRERLGISAEEFAKDHDIPLEIYNNWEKEDYLLPEYMRNFLMTALDRYAAGKDSEQEDEQNENPGPFSGRGAETGIIALEKGVYHTFYFPAECVRSIAKYAAIKHFPKAAVRADIRKDESGDIEIVYSTGFEGCDTFFFNDCEAYDGKFIDIVDHIVQNVFARKDEDFSWDDAIEYIGIDLDNFLEWKETGKVRTANIEPEEPEDEEYPLTNKTDGENTTLGEFRKTLEKCWEYEEQAMCYHLLLEIGKLSALADFLEKAGIDVYSDELICLYDIRDELIEHE